MSSKLSPKQREMMLASLTAASTGKAPYQLMDADHPRVLDLLRQMAGPDVSKLAPLEDPAVQAWLREMGE